MADEKKRSVLQQLREGTIGKAVDRAMDAADKFLGPSGKAWLANGLEELRQAVALGHEQVQGGHNPGLWGTITTGEATAERLAGDHDKEKVLRTSMDVPPETTLDKARGYAKSPGREPEDGKDRGHESGGLEM